MSSPGAQGSRTQGVVGVGVGRMVVSLLMAVVMTVPVAMPMGVAVIVAMSVIVAMPVILVFAVAMVVVAMLMALLGHDFVALEQPHAQQEG